MLNPDLNIAALAEQYRDGERVRIDNVLNPEIATKIHDYCLSDVPFEFVHVHNGKHLSWSAEDAAGKSQAELQRVQQDIWRDAKKGTGYQYSGYRRRDADRNNPNEKLQFLHGVLDYMNGPEMLDLATRITGCDDIRSADAHFTRFTNGQFLTRHRDVVDGADRRIAYVMSFSRDWHPDWGGLLQFYEEDGTPKDAWTPHFNSLNLFDIKHIHAVTYVTPFSGSPRLSMTGWFRSTPQADEG